MRILVTGGAGFIGSNFILRHIEKPEIEKIVNYDKVTYAADINFVVGFKHPKYDFVQEDILDYARLLRVAKDHGITHIIHFAAESHVDNSISAPDRFIETNIVGTHNVLRAALNQKIRLLHVSTDEVFGSLKEGDTELFCEDSPYQPNSPYSASKASSDLLVRSYCKTYALDAVITNCSNNFGPRQHKEKFIPKVINCVLKGEKIPVYGNGLNVRDWIYVDDHNDALWEILTRAKSGQRYNIGASNEYSNIALVQKICELMDFVFDDTKKYSFEELVEFVGDRAAHDFRYGIDSSKLVSDLNWYPKVHFMDGLIKTILWYKDQTK